MKDSLLEEDIRQIKMKDIHWISWKKGKSTDK